jgi:cytochrome c oxidase assembly protein subunit 15
MATTATTPQTQVAAFQNLTRFAWAVVACNILVILWGALVRATGSGAGCGNHWPLCNGQVIPLAPNLHTIIEFTHRMMVGGATFAVFGLLAWTLLATPKGLAARPLAIASTILLLNEAFLGALLVKLGYVTVNQSLGRVIVLSIHLSNTLLLLAALTLTALFLTTRQRTRHLRTRHAPIILTGLAATLLVGVTGSLAALGDTLFPATSLTAAIAQDFATASPWLLRVRWVHPASAILAAAFVFWLARKAWPTQRTLVTCALSLLAFQFALGLLDIALLAPIWLQILHLFGADLYWVALVTLAAATLWPPTYARSEIVFSLA